MRTTLNIEDDVLQAAKTISKRQKKNVGQVISELARKGLNLRTSYEVPGAAEEDVFYGFRPLPKHSDVIITNDLIDTLREEDIY